jgi:hypothetical protein
MIATAAKTTMSIARPVGLKDELPLIGGLDVLSAVCELAVTAGHTIPFPQVIVEQGVGWPFKKHCADKLV